MTESAWWYVLAGFLIGFILSTLWEWLYFRRRRLRIENRRIAELEATVRSMTLAGSNGGSATAPGLPGDYQGPGVFLESERLQVEAETVTTAYPPLTAYAATSAQPATAARRNTAVAEPPAAVERTAFVAASRHSAAVDEQSTQPPPQVHATPLTPPVQQPVQPVQPVQQPAQPDQPVQLVQPAQPPQPPLSVQSAQPVEPPPRTQPPQPPQPLAQDAQPFHSAPPVLPSQPLRQPPPPVPNGLPLQPAADKRNGFSADAGQADAGQADAAVVTRPPARQAAPAVPALNSFLPTAPPAASAGSNGSYALADPTARALAATGIQPGIQRVSSELDSLRASLERLIATTDPLLDSAAADHISHDDADAVGLEPAVTGPYAARNLSRAEYAVVRFMQSARQLGRDLRGLYGRE